MDELLTMSKKELTRKEIMQRLEEKRIKQREAADALGITDRHVRRLLRVYRQGGVAGLISRRRGRLSNNQLDEILKNRVLSLLHSTYSDFGPTLACEKLAEQHGLNLSVESVRQMMIAEGIWKPRMRKRARVHQLRLRRVCVGELVQIDGSPHDWFEDRGPRCNLLVYVDDASGRLMELFFTLEETTFSYFEATRSYLTRHGLPQAFYSDRNSIFRVNNPHPISGNGMTQFGRAMRQLGIKIICANTPQAKGRVERMNLTLQDRLVKELRLHNISDIDRANAFIPTFIAAFNRKFAVQPKSSYDAHLPLQFSRQEVDHIFSLHHTRTISKNLTLQYNKVIYQIQTRRPSYALRKAQVTVCENIHGRVSIAYKGKLLDYSIFNKQARQAEVVPSKQLNSHVEKKAYRPAPNHPWRNYGNRLNGKNTPKKQDAPS